MVMVQNGQNARMHFCLTYVSRAKCNGVQKNLKLHTYIMSLSYRSLSVFSMLSTVRSGRRERSDSTAKVISILSSATPYQRLSKCQSLMSETNKKKAATVKSN